MRAIFINSTAHTIEEIELPEGETKHLAELQKRVGGYIETAHRFRNGDTLFVNEEGLFKFETYFAIIGAHQPFAGNGVIVGAEVDERQTPAKMSMTNIKTLCRFLNRRH